MIIKCRNCGKKIRAKKVYVINEITQERCDKCETINNSLQSSNEKDVEIFEILEKSWIQEAYQNINQAIE